MVKDPMIFQVVGYQNSGKTTIVKEIIQALKDDWRIVTIKHHGHGEAPELPSSKKDSGQHIQSGAFASVVEGGGHLLLQTKESDWDLHKQIQLVKGLDPDLILIEGHKKASFEKLVIVRKKEDLELISSLQNIKLIVYWDEVIDSDIKEFRSDVPLIYNDSDGISSTINIIKNQLLSL